MDLAVVIVTHNQHDVLRNCLRSVLAAMDGIAGEVIVVDNASTDGTAEVMEGEFPQVRYLRNPVNVHYTRAVNQGMRATRGRYVMLLNDDTVAQKDSLRRLIMFMDDHPRCGAVGPALLGPGGDVQVSAQRFPTPVREMAIITGAAWHLRNRRWAAGLQMNYPPPDVTRLVDWVCGGALFLRRSVMERLGYHDERYLFYRDDPDIGLRLRAAGWEVWYCPESRFVHYHGMSSVKTPKRVRFDLIAVRSRRHYFCKFHGWFASAMVESCDGLCALLRAGKSLLMMRFQTAREQWEIVRSLIAASVTPKEELEAMSGYRLCQYNGVNGGPGASQPGESAADGAATNKQGVVL